MRFWSRVTANALLALFAPACGLISGLDGLKVPDAAADAVSEASGDAGPLSDPVVIAMTGNVAFATGLAQQTHLVWAAISRRWWLFYIDGDAQNLKTRFSADFATWSDGPSLPLLATNAGEARNFSVAYAAINGSDIVHLSISHQVAAADRRHSQSRAIINGDTLTFSPSPSALVCSTNDLPSSNAPNPDGPAVAISTTGRVYDASGFTKNAAMSSFNAEIFVSAGLDDGKVFIGQFNQNDLQATSRAVNARAAVDLVTCWESADAEPNSSNVACSNFGASAWSSPIIAFPDKSGVQSANDWNLFVLDAVAHVVRARTDGVIEETQGIVGSLKTTALPPLARFAVGNGLAAANTGGVAVLVDVDSTNQLRKLKFDGKAWAQAWDVIDSRPRARLYLQATSVPTAALADSGGLAVIWTETVGQQTEIVGQRFMP